MPFPDKFNLSAYRQSRDARAQKAAALIHRCGEAKDITELARIVVREIEEQFDNGTAHPTAFIPLPEHLRQATVADETDEPGDVTSDQFIEMQLAKAIWPLLNRPYVESVMVHTDPMGTSMTVKMIMGSDPN